MEEVGYADLYLSKTNNNTCRNILSGEVMHSEFYLIFLERRIQNALLDHFTDTFMFIYFNIRAGEDGAFFCEFVFYMFADYIL